MDHALRRRVAGRGGGRDVLAAHALGVAPGEPHHLAQPPGQRGLAGEDAEPGARREALPAAPPPAGAGRPGGVHHHVADLAREATRADLHPACADDAAADPGAEGHHHDVVVAAGGPEAVLGQHGEIGVVLNEDAPPRQAVPDELGPVHPLGLGQVGCEAQAPVPVDHARRADPDRCAARRTEAPVELDHHLGHRLGHVAAHDLAVAGGRRDPGLGDDVVARAERDAEHLRPADVDAVGDAGCGRRARIGARAGHEIDSTRAFSSRMAVAMMRLVARILMKPGIGTRSSASRW